MKKFFYTVWKVIVVFITWLPIAYVLYRHQRMNLMKAKQFISTEDVKNHVMRSKESYQTALKDVYPVMVQEDQVLLTKKFYARFGVK